ncbi:hypothetical protein OAL14_02770 [Gammaproteobacteria bacterium]|nr:hypothetical protein [Gammaproteobacteria bacterium]
MTKPISIVIKYFPLLKFNYFLLLMLVLASPVLGLEEKIVSLEKDEAKTQQSKDSKPTIEIISTEEESNDEFVPTEQISEDFAVPFPSDI